MKEKDHCIERVFSLSLSRLVVHHHEALTDLLRGIKGLAVLITSSPILEHNTRRSTDGTRRSSGVSSASSPTALVTRLPKNTVAVSPIVELRSEWTPKTDVDTGEQLEFRTSYRYRHELLSCDPKGAAVPSLTLSVSLIALHAVANKATGSSSYGGQRFGKRPFLVVASAEVPLPVQLYASLGSSVLSLMRAVPPSGSSLLTVGFVDVVIEDTPYQRSKSMSNLHALPSYRYRYLRESGVNISSSDEDESFVVLEGAAAAASKTKRVANDVKRKAKLLFDRVKSAFESSSNVDDSPDDTASSIGESEPPAAARELISAAPLTRRHEQPLPLVLPAESGPVDGDGKRSPLPKRSHSSHADPSSTRTAETVADSQGVMTSKLITMERTGFDIECLPCGVACKRLTSNVQSLQDVAHLILIECGNPDSEREIRAATKRCQWCLPRSCVVFCEDRSDVVHVIRTFLSEIVRAPWMEKTLPCIWIVASDDLCCAGAAEISLAQSASANANAVAAVMFLSPPTLDLGYDDIPRASLTLHGVRTSQPRPNSFDSLFQRFDGMFRKTKVGTPMALHALPVTHAVLEVIGDDGTVDQQHVYFAKCLHLLCTSGMEVRYASSTSAKADAEGDGQSVFESGTPYAPGASVSSRNSSALTKRPKLQSMKRDPVIVGLYRFPCQGHFEFALHSDVEPSLRMWTTRKHLEGLTVESNAIAPRIICTSLYGEEVRCVTCDAPGHGKRMADRIYVFVDSDRLPSFTEDKSSGQLVPSCNSAGGREGENCDAIICRSVVVNVKDDIAAPLFPLS